MPRLVQIYNEIIAPISEIFKIYYYFFFRKIRNGFLIISSPFRKKFKEGCFFSFSEPFNKLVFSLQNISKSYIFIFSEMAIQSLLATSFRPQTVRAVLAAEASSTTPTRSFQKVSDPTCDLEVMLTFEILYSNHSSTKCVNLD